MRVVRRGVIGAIVAGGRHDHNSGGDCVVDGGAKDAGAVGCSDCGRIRPVHGQVTETPCATRYIHTGGDRAL